MDVMRGNKGEWSEPYVFLKLLGDGRIYGADGSKKRLDNVFYDIKRVIRTDTGHPIHYVLIPSKSLIEIRDGDAILGTVSMSEMTAEYRYLFNEIINTNNKEIPRTEKFLKSLHCTKLKSPSSEKVDVNLEIYEPQIGMDVQQGFSIKSDFAAKSTLINSSKSTNAIFELIGVDQSLMDKANKCFLSKSKTKIQGGMKILTEHNVEMVFRSFQNEILEDNLTMLDAHLPSIVGEMLLCHYRDRNSTMVGIVDALNQRNPLGYRNLDTRPYYAAKIRRLLSAYALGMESATPWDGEETTKGGYIIVKEDGEIICYHICDRNDFEEYLIRNTKMETPSTSRHEFGRVYSEDGHYFLKLNLQVRFI